MSLFEPVEPVHAAPPTTGLVASAPTITTGRWHQGFAWRPERCPDATFMEPYPCGALGFGSLVGGGDTGVVYHRPQAFRVEDTCSTRQGSDSSRVRRQAEAVTSFMVARELETGALTRANPYTTPDDPAGVTVNAYLASAATVVEAGTWEPYAGLGRVEQLARADALGQDVFIHMPVSYVPLVANVLVQRGTQLFTLTGARVVADAGYTGGGLLGAGTSEVQTVTITGTPTGGTFTLTFNGATTTPIAFNATAAAVDAALEALDTIPPGQVAVTGSAGGPYTVTFAAVLGNVSALTKDATGLTGGTTPDVVVATTTPGVAPAQAAGNWLYATGPVAVRLAEPVVNDVPDWRDNQWIYTADRLFGTQMDPCNQHAINIIVPTPA